jgi:hypothetical protein
MDAAWELTFYRDVGGDAPVQRAIERLPPKLQARVFRALDLLSEHGTALTAPLVLKVRGESFW